MPVQLVAGAVDHRGVGVDGQVVAVGDGAELGRDLDEHRGRCRSARWGRWRSASARASSSRSPTRRRMRCEERSADRAASPRSPSSTSASSSRLARTRSAACAARARRRPRTGAGASQRALGLLARGLEPSSMACSVCASSATSSSARGWGSDFDGSRVRSMSWAAAVSSAIGAIARRPSSDAAEQREQRAAEHARAEEQADAPDGGLDVGDLARVLDDQREHQPLGVADRDAALASLHAVAADARRARQEDAEVRRVLRLAQDRARGLRDRGSRPCWRRRTRRGPARRSEVPSGEATNRMRSDEVVDRGGHLVVEVRADARGRRPGR